MSRNVELEWQDDNHDASTLEYVIQLTAIKTNGIIVNQTVDKGRTFALLQNLAPFTSYKVQIHAVNSAGSGMPSSPLEFQTLEESKQAHSHTHTHTNNLIN